MYSGAKLVAEVEYPCEVGNLSKSKKLVRSREEHLEHALAATKGTVRERLSTSKYPIQHYISDDAFLLHAIYIDAKRWGISWLYQSNDDIPNLVKFGLDIISSEYDRLESEEIKSSSNTPKAEPTKISSR